MENEINEFEKAIDDRLEELIDKCFSGEIDDSDFFLLTVLNQLDKQLLSYCEGKPHHLIGLIIRSISKDRLTPKTKQKLKEELEKIRRAVNDIDSDAGEKEEAINEAIDKIDNMFVKILEFVKDK
jgi:uncharacterized protein YgfB (UPF0149 family)